MSEITWAPAAELLFEAQETERGVEHAISATMADGGGGEGAGASERLRHKTPITFF